MNYNLYFSTKTGKFNILNLTEDKLIKVIKAYLEGLDSVTITGDKYILKAVYEFKIFTFEPNGDPIEAIRYLLSNINFHKKTSDGKYLPTTTLATIGKDVTNNFIGDKEFGEASESTKSATKNESGNFINLNRLNELRNINSPKFDLAILIKLCEELNDNYKNGNYLSVAMNCRTILNHVPPIFGMNAFDQISSSYGSANANKSFKKNMLNLQNSLKNIADRYLHQQIRNKETLPNETQIDFKQDMDVLFEEIVRILK